MLPFRLPAPADGAVDVLIIAGEHSGDEHAARLVRELRAAQPGVRVAALGGSELAAAGAQLFTVFVALQEIADHQGPTRFLPYTHTCTISHRELERDSPDAAFCQRAPSVSALLGVGDVALYDSRTLHCGGPHRAPANLAEIGVERVLFYVSFKHALTTEADLSNRDVHGAGSILPSVAAHKMCLGALRARRSPQSGSA